MILITDSNLIVSALITPHGAIASIIKAKHNFQFIAPDFIFDEIIQIAKNGEVITITKFGSFQIKKHKGHPTSLSRREIKDYSYLRFSPSGRLNKEIRVDLGERMQA